MARRLERAIPVMAMAAEMAPDRPPAVRARKRAAPGNVSTLPAVAEAKQRVVAVGVEAAEVVAVAPNRRVAVGAVQSLLAASRLAIQVLQANPRMLRSHRHLR